MAASSETASHKVEATDCEDDPYLWLEEVESEASLEFAKASNAACLAALGDPRTKGSTYARVLRVLESNDRIPYVTQAGLDDANGDEPILLNFWKDQDHPKGLLRSTSLTSYRTARPEWTTLLDIDALSEEDGVSYVYKGSTKLPRSLDTGNDGKNRLTRGLLQLSRGGSDAVTMREFDFVKAAFVTDQPFIVPEAKSRVSYKSRNVVLVGTDFKDGNSLTDSGYPRTVREWVRGTDLVKDSRLVFEGETTDVAVGMYISDERVWGGGIYEVQYRSMTFYTSKYWIRKVEPEHLLAPEERVGASDPPDFSPVDIQDDASFSLVGRMMIISLRSDWTVGGTTYIKGSQLVTDADTFLTQGAEASKYSLLFEPTPQTAYEYFACTKNYLILSTSDNVKSKLDFFRITDHGFDPVGGSMEPQIRDCSASSVDATSGSDLFWFTTSDYVTPTTLCLADAARVGDGSTRKTEQDAFITERLKSLPEQYDASQLTIEQRTAVSKDGTKVPYFIVLPKDIALDGSNPTLLYGYGGFEVSLGPHYIATSGLAWLERGGVYVEANIRGGGEFGPSWHQAALKEKRCKSYEDFIAVGEHLVESGICTPQKLAARGGSNGGLLMGNIFTMRPDLFGAIHCAVPLLDMKRFHKLLAGASWMAEYGDPDTEDWDNFLHKYSPYHNIDPDASYPPILVTTSTRDDRVHPAHARKFVKKLQELGKGKWPVHYYENIEGGHAGAADAKQSAFMTALAYDFMFETLTKD